ncbi:luciferase family oxidoreductase group 1 [Jatrophihabitans sp. GAS493]|uniref:LLM class flavin-dependent oxidoreductase n=1 Tax=Jatrophihabitans sp. GAS493 TaxID=1907575 RepID=UPI000BB82379|nr:LLM class flavin-dependent oxidoreductase [Jatrophihabitans sp. GAS493]SOD73962.1 luciferase family oxidoreductase group 1 [Jatrophihabitans sp. GAS493]
MTPRPLLSVLDLATVGSGQTSSVALHNSTELAQAADRLGFSRFWVAEHHNMAGVASTAPPVLIAHLAAATSRIRVGSGGVMLPNHSPLVVAEQFALLEALHPDRIDVGLGRAPGTDPHTAAALRRNPAAGGLEEFLSDILDVRALLSASSATDDIAATPLPVSAPEVWVLGSSLSSAVVAAALGLPYAFAHHFSAENTVPAVELYRQRFKASESLDQPHVLITSSVIAAPTDAEAEEIALPAALMWAEIRRGVRRPLRSVAEAKAHPWSDQERLLAEDRLATSAVGSAITVAAKLDKLVADTGADELMVTVHAHDVAHRVRTLEILAQTYASQVEAEPELLRSS